MMISIQGDIRAMAFWHLKHGKNSDRQLARRLQEPAGVSSAQTLALSSLLEESARPFLQNKFVDAYINSHVGVAFAGRSSMALDKYAVAANFKDCECSFQSHSRMRRISSSAHH